MYIIFRCKNGPKFGTNLLFIAKRGKSIRCLGLPCSREGASACYQILYDELANFFVKGLDNKYFRFFGPYDLCYIYSTVLYWRAKAAEDNM